MKEFYANLSAGWPWMAGATAILVVYALILAYVPALAGIVFGIACIVGITWLIGWLIRNEF